MFSGNRFRDLRFAVHYMYTNDGEVTDNVSIGNTVGYAVMYSHRLIVRGNVSDGDRDRGFLFNFANGSQISGNTVIGRAQPAERWAASSMRGGEAREHGLAAVDETAANLGRNARIGPEKCVFIYNTNQNRFRNNWFEGCEIGVHFTAGSEGNEIVGNAFVRNRNQVKYVGTRHLDWSRNGHGNYWSDNPAFDLNGDGIADTAYRPNDLVDRVLWTAPQAKVLMNSPAVQVIRWAQAQFPALLPGGVVDSHPADGAAHSPEDRLGNAAMSAATVHVRQVTKRFGKVGAVRGVSFDLERGETVALVGHNGAGKTTLIKLMLGLIRPTSGSVEVLGDDPAAGQFSARKELGFLPENVAFNSGLTGRETLSFYARLKRQPASAIAPLLERVGLADAAGRRVGTYSKGMRQRLGLAQALLGEPRVLLLDEPTTGLDPALRQSFYETVEELRGRGATVLLSSHALTELEERAGRVIIMNRGVKVADGTLDELRRIARLPTKIRLRVTERGLANMPEWLGPVDTWRRVNGRTVEIDASPEGKIELLRRATDESAPVEDLDIVPPTLDQLYAHFLRSEAAAP